MICSINELGISKCEEYFPEEGKFSYDSFEIFLVQTEEIFDSLIERVFRIFNLITHEIKIVTHLHGKNWPDQGAPSMKKDYKAIDYIMKTIKNKRLLNPFCKVAVHCSAGKGRTGLLIGIYNMIIALEDLIELDALNNTNHARVSVFGTTRRLREQR